MLLKEYKIKNNLTLQELANLFGVSGQNPRQTTRRWVEGMRIPRFHFMENIEKATRGQVKFEDLVNGYSQKQKS